ncbi:group II intron maturase-specific domain-containing protein [Clostridium algidicarnis]|uniref:Group II intron maturase-specific domain-containing protein n=1 Tax=Clostridium algidicarnis TaxID=37659 RepID=A0ABS6C6G4_9CLOT|nr:group II intron maturase-specific domain-containing protein [Clostridium algidicarnis]MBU3194855.1 hypothetical protein [Clostridium algidicarnis]MBU3221030.1 hypothetical protein [Clostridium algidicarnis]
MTSSKKFRASIKRLGEWLKDNRTLPLTLLMKKLKQKLVGYYRYYGITDNSKKLDNFRYLVRRLTFKWLNRRSQRRSYNWISFDRMFNYFNIPKAKIYVNIFKLKEEITYIM